MVSLRATLAVEGMSCTSCAQTVENAARGSSKLEQIAVDPISGRTIILVPDRESAIEIAQLITDSGFNATVLEVLPVAAASVFQVQAAIGGMTCAACANTVRDLTKDVVESAQIDPLSGNATFIINDESKAADLREIVEDAGYDYTEVSVKAIKNVQEHTNARMITLQIQGMFCEHCPKAVMDVFKSYGDAVEIEKKVSLEKPTVEFKYVPSPPEFGIRAIIDEIKLKAPELECVPVEPKSPEQVAHEYREREKSDIIKRLKVTGALALPAFVIMWFPMFMMSWTGKLVMLALSTPVYFYSAAVFHKHAFSSASFISPFKFGSMNLLMSLGTSISYWASILLLIFDPRADSYFDSVIFLTLFLLFGRYLDVYSKAKTATAVSSLNSLRPDEALVQDKELNFDTEPLWKIDVGDFVKVPAGSKVGVDGIIISGTSQLDEATLTGESRPVPKSKGDSVFSGTINVGNEALVLKAVAVDKGTLLDGIVDAVRQGQMVRAHIERFTDTVTAIFVPIVIYLALGVWAVWYILGKAGYVPLSELKKCHCGWFVFAMEFAVAVFVVACPCGVGLAAPTALYVGGGVAAKHGIVSRGGGEAFEEGSNVQVVCFDKTGTITTSNPKVTDVWFPQPLVDVDAPLKDELVQLAARMEDDSTHPLAIAVKNYAIAEIKESRVENVRAVPGKGVRANISAGPYSGKEAFLGNERLIEDSKMKLSAEETKILSEWKSQGKSVMILSIESQVQMMLAAADEIRPEAKSTMQLLQARGIDCWMISGDNIETARAVAHQVGIPQDNVIAQVLPEEKASKIQWLQSTGMAAKKHDSRAIVAMVGDGVNDAPALAVSDVGIAIGTGADITLSTAKFVLVHSDLAGVAVIFDLSRAVMRKVKLNFLWAGVYNLVAVPVAAGIFYPWTGYRLDPIVASLAMCLSSLSVMANSLLLRRYQANTKTV